MDLLQFLCDVLGENFALSNETDHRLSSHYIMSLWFVPSCSKIIPKDCFLSKLLFLTWRAYFQYLPPFIIIIIYQTAQQIFQQTFLDSVGELIIFDHLSTNYDCRPPTLMADLVTLGSRKVINSPVNVLVTKVTSPVLLRRCFCTVTLDEARILADRLCFYNVHLISN